MADYSGWVLADDNNSQAVAQAPESNSPPKDYSGWEMAPVAPNSMRPQSDETLGQAALKAPFRVGEDIYRSGANAIKGLPKDWEAVKTYAPEIYGAVKQNPMHALGQGVAGLGELGQNIFNMPHDIANYATNRLNLLPQDINQKIQMGRMPDSQEDINATFGKPQNAGEEALRWGGRNAENLLGAAGLANVINPMNLTKSGIVRNVLREGDRQVDQHSRMYDSLWHDADRAGLNNVPIDHNLVGENLNFIQKYKSPREYKTLEQFNQEPTLPNAQKAVSDIRGMTRALDEKSRTNSLTGEEKHLYDALQGTEKHIEGNMFLNPDGTVNEGLANRYKTITNSYRENVVPYRYNSAIQAYKNKEITKKQLINSLSTGEFAAKKGSKHPALTVRNALIYHPYLTGASLGAAGLGAYHNVFGTGQPE